jgi:hypothetical protein
MWLSVFLALLIVLVVAAVVVELKNSKKANILEKGVKQAILEADAACSHRKAAPAPPKDDAMRP